MVVFLPKRKVFRLLNHLRNADAFLFREEKSGIPESNWLLTGFNRALYHSSSSPFCQGFIPGSYYPQYYPEGKLDARDSNPHPPPELVALFQLS